ncbi:MAG: exopolyphosphatase [Candidatus Thiodiazotropha endolucinida]|nr:exopolyphosphatase [Candidatus Thiodiazotropha taylori]MCW4224967.1 exopolyphosphatase [Candidatus Thiodiazotropha endolucinida]MCG7882124.1 exopolyphosphatase [Candidatus Thiodiazotropha taylori]MCG7886538.1 exopolyphosphatase [Candidatus Thiodiazotropha taylori]MCG7891726.1 exopolyphosphatase [Candidatus Thiodiazotropha taylori]
MPEQTPEANLNEAIAAIDLGSNSFHLIVARVIDGHLQIIDRMKEMVRLGEGLTADKHLMPHVAERALECLRRYAQRLRPLPAENIRVVGTNTMRQIHPDDNFHGLAEKALLHPIEIIAGREEARLIYLGVAHGLAAGDEMRLVVDIGGGSTELITGQGYQSHERESLHMGCVSISRRFFTDGKITAQAMRDAELACSLEIRPVRYEFRDGDWTRAIGSSGSIKSIGNVVLQQGWSETGIYRESLERLKRTLIEAGSIHKLDLKGLSEERKPVFAGGLAVLSAIFDQIGIEHMEVSSEALREGLIYDMVGRNQQEDARERTLKTLMRRYDVDQEQVDRVETTALALLEQVKRAWNLQEPRHTAMLSWSAKVHEMGLTVSHSQFQKHGAYLLEKSDLSGFSLQEQKVLAALVRGHRRKFPTTIFEALPRDVVSCTKQLCILLRLSVLTHRARSTVAKPVPRLEVEDHKISLVFPEEWIAHHPLTHKELEQEADYLKSSGYLLRFS